MNSESCQFRSTHLQVDRHLRSPLAFFFCSPVILILRSSLLSTKIPRLSRFARISTSKREPVRALSREIRCHHDNLRGTVWRDRMGMTAWIQDEMFYKEREYSIVRMDGEGRP